MIDPLTIGAGAAASLLALDPVKRLLGPTADFLGAELGAFTKRRFLHAEKIIEMAAEHVPEPDGKIVSPRVLLATLDEGSKVEGELGQRYFAGVLAASRSENGEDDGGIVFTSILSTMSSAQMKLHCALYTALRMRWAGSAKNLGEPDHRTAAKTLIAFSAFSRLFGREVHSELETGMFSLHRNGLVENFRYFETGVHQPSGSVLPYLWFQPTVLGCQLFLAANGHNQRSASEILNDKLMFKAMLDIRMDEVFTASELTKIDPGQIKPPGPIPPS